mmetsp:Transcript_63052/g.199547  ORF Transcript_63052/g.199547 Transcript_63052/m.199547 type:complete len:243 (+) Transcript_63052:485-1213(+)
MPRRRGGAWRRRPQERAKARRSWGGREEQAPDRKCPPSPLCAGCGTAPKGTAAAGSANCLLDCSRLTETPAGGSLPRWRGRCCPHLPRRSPQTQASLPGQLCCSRRTRPLPNPLPIPATARSPREHDWGMLGSFRWSCAMRPGRRGGSCRSSCARAALRWRCAGPPRWPATRGGAAPSRMGGRRRPPRPSRRTVRRRGRRGRPAGGQGRRPRAPLGTRRARRAGRRGPRPIEKSPRAPHGPP